MSITSSQQRDVLAILFEEGFLDGYSGFAHQPASDVESHAYEAGYVAGRQFFG